MNIEEFIEKFLSDKDENEDYKKYNLLVERQDKVEDPLSFILVVTKMYAIQNRLFEIALQNFADRICEKQRLLCSYFTYPDIVASEGIYHTEQPKIDEL